MATRLPPAGAPDVLYVLDMSGFVFRAYHGVAPLSNSKGEPTHATFGYATMLSRLVRDQRPAYLAVAIDSKEGSFRKDRYPEYKATRPPPPPDLSVQMERCRELTEAYAIPILGREGFEADDLIAACVKEARAHGLKTVIASSDKDLMQLVGEDVLLWDAMRNRVFGPDEVREKWGVPPAQVRDLLALMGDASDNVPGVRGVGEKTAAKLLQEHGSLDDVLARAEGMKGKLRENLLADAELARLSRELVTLRDDIGAGLDLASLRYGGWDPDRVRALLAELEFRNLLALVQPAQPSLALGGPAAPAPSPPPPPRPVAPVTEPAARCIRDAASLQQSVQSWSAPARLAVGVHVAEPADPFSELVGLSFAAVDGAAYVPLAHRVLGDGPHVSREDLVASVAPLLAAHRALWFHDAKFADIVLRRAGLPVHAIAGDTMLASYLLDPERHGHSLDEIADSEMHRGLPQRPDEPVGGRARSVRASAPSFETLDGDAAMRIVAPRTAAVWELAAGLGARLSADAELQHLFDHVEIPLARALGRMEEHGVRVDVSRLRDLGSEVARELERIERELHAIVGRPFNVSAPRQLETILFDELGLRVVKRTKTARSTDHDVLEELADDHPLPAKVLEHRQLAKLQSTYLETLPKQVRAQTGRIHTTFDQAVAATGRLSSNDPNLQNIPIRSELGRRIRNAFVPPDGWWILSADYSQIELRVLAHLSEDPILLDAFARDEDIHTRTAMEIFHVAADGVTREMRARAKTTNFAVIYGQGESALARQLGIPRTEAAEFIQRYFATFPRLAGYLDAVVEAARAGEGVRTLLGRKRPLPGLRSGNRVLRAQAERIARNTPIQGTAADIMKVAMIAVDAWLQSSGLQTRMILTVHDELVFEVPEDERGTVEHEVVARMAGALALRVPLRVEAGWGRSWGEAH